jgi:beta-glucanase (GH16 family)
MGLAVGAPIGASAAAATTVVFDDMEHGDPFNNGWFAFDGAVGGGGISANADVPPVGGGSFSLETGWGSGGTAGFYGVFGRDFVIDTTGTDHFNFWINPNAGQSYTLELNLQESGLDPDEFQFNCVVSDTGPCATAGAGWQLVSIPLADFVDDNSFITTGDGVLDPGIATVVVAVIGSGTDVNFRTDYWAFSAAPLVPRTVVDDFENGLPSGADADGAPLGFYTFQGAGSSVAISTQATPSPAPTLPAVGDPNNVMTMDVNVTSFAGYIHAFENDAVDTWVTQDWSRAEGISFWMYGQGSGTQLFIDILDNRNPGSTEDDAERFTAAFVDDFSGWQLLEFPFASFVRKEIGNGAPNDGLGLVAMHGYALGTLNTDGPRTYYVDEVSVYGVGEPPALAVNFSRQNTFIEEGTTGQVGVRLNRAMGPDDPAQLSIDYATERSNAIPGEEFTPTSGTLTFVNGGPSELFFDVETFDDTKFEGDEQVVIRLTNPVDVERGALFQGSVLIDDNDDFDAKLLDDFEQGAYLWDSEGTVDLDAQRVEVGDADERPGQDQVENVGSITSSASSVDKQAFDEAERQVRQLERAGAPQDQIDEIVASAADWAKDAVEIATLNGGDKRRLDQAQRRIDDAEAAAAAGRDSKAVQDYRKAWQEATKALDALRRDGQVVSAGTLVRDFALGQDWTGTESLDFWFKGTGSGDPVTVTLKDNRAPDPGPSGWDLAWADEFDDPAGTPPNPANWAYEIGDTTPDGKNGWGNEELQYYTDDPDNAATDGNGNLVITLDEADGSQECYYGPCEFESARLITQNKAEFAYGRIESRLQVPTGGDGLWPAFWSLGTDITYNPWPGAGEIDVMEYVSRIPNEIFGTIHGPGYAGGESFSGIWDFGERVDLDYHTFAVEWEPETIRWYVDDILYHEAAPADVAPNPWVFEKPFFLLLNFAIGGNFGGAIDPNNTYPQEYLVDYVRVYQGPDTAERFDATFTDSSTEWQQVSIPVTEFVRSDEQPAGAPDDGLGLDEVWGYAIDLPYPVSGGVKIDLVRRTPVPPPTDLVVTTLADSGEGSLRDALGRIADGGTITFDPSLAGGTMTLTSGQLAIDGSVTVDASAAAPVTISAGGASRVLQVAAGAQVSMNDLVLRDGVAAPQGGGIFNLGDLSLERVVVTENTQDAAGPANFEFGGGGIYNGDSATLSLTDSTVSDNTSVNQPGGGVYGFFNSSITVTQSTISGNVAGDVAGGLRTLGDATIVNSTVSGNTSTAWHGGGIFHTDGVLTVTNSTFAENVAPAGTASGILVATFGAAASATITNSVLQGEGGAFACAIEGGAAAVLTSGGSNVISDGSCNPIASDQSNTDALLGPLADNGGPTLTHALLEGSPAIDAADDTVCPETDQRGVTRPQGSSCDVGSYERE